MVALLRRFNSVGSRDFDENRWNLIKMRWCSLIAIASYPLWLTVKWILDVDTYDPAWQRFLAPSLNWAVLILSFTKLEQKRLEDIYSVSGFLLTAHMFYLAYMNDVQPLYMLGAYCVLACMGYAMLNMATLAKHALFTLCLCVLLCIFCNNLYAYQLGFCSLTAFATSFAALKSQEILIYRLKSSRSSLENNNKALDSMLNSLGQGFFSFGSDGICFPVYSRACLKLLETEPVGKHVFDVLRLKVFDRSEAVEYMEKVFAGDYPFDALELILPPSLPDSQGQVDLKYIPTYAADESVAEVIVVATDNTERMHAEREAEKQRRQAHMIATITKEKSAFRVFYADCVDTLNRYLSVPAFVLQQKETVSDFKRFLHTLKGNAGVFGIDEVAHLAHQLEDVWAEGNPRPSADDVILREQLGMVQAALEKFVNTYADVLGSGFRAERHIELKVSKFKGIVSQPDFQNAPERLKEDFYLIAREKIQSYFEVYGLMCANIAKQKAKKIREIEFLGGDLMIVPEAYLGLFSAFVHVFRNAVEHGIELPSHRLEAGKNEYGKISVEFQRKEIKGKSWIVIQVRDDGRGIDPRKIRSKLLESGEAEENINRLTDAQVIQKVFVAGFSTSETVSELSGRGVGMDAVLFHAERLGGTAQVTSTVGVGTVITIRVADLHPAEVYKDDVLKAVA